MMDNIILAAFITGITTGGLSCMAVQGGLITSSLANRLEVELRPTGKPGAKNKLAVPAPKPDLAQPILFFLAAKVAAYTVMGFLLGALGSVLSLTPVMRGILQVAIGLFMVGNALRMFNVHPIFRYFNFEPPSSVTRYIRKKSKNSNSALTPLLLGLMTVLIPCGVSQSMMALAVGTGSPVTGAVIMLAFTLGTSPVFFGLTYLATRLGSLLEKNFMRVVAVALLLFGLWTFDTGLNLMGSPVSFTRLPQLVAEAMSPSSTLQTFDPNPVKNPGFIQQDAAAAEGGVINISVTDNGYNPQRVRAPAGTPIKLVLTSENVHSCSRAFTIPALDMSKLLPETGSETLEIPAQKAGTKLQFACSMGMFTGVIIFQ
jgi:sulfite exporter TauE/SafE